MTPREWDEWNLRVNKPLMCWSLEKPGTILIHDYAIWAVIALYGAAALALMYLVVVMVW